MGALGAGTFGFGVVGAGVLGAGVLGAGVLGAGVLGAGVLGAGVLGAGVLGAGGVAAGLAFHISFTSASTFFGVEWTRMMVWVRPPLPTSSCPAFAWPVREELSLTSPAGASAGTSRKSSWPVKSDLLDACTSAYVGAWILAHSIKRHGLTWRAVGAYNSPTPANQKIYAEKVNRALAQRP